MGLNIQDLEVECTSFGFGERCPDRITKEHDDVSPELRWSGVPEGTKQVAVICHDPDAPLPYGFTHWVVYGIPADVDRIEEGGGAKFTEGTNDFGEEGYGGPLPPEGHGPHHYYFWVYALDSEIDAGPGLSRAELLSRIEDHIIEQNRVVGTYSR